MNLTRSPRLLALIPRHHPIKNVLLNLVAGMSEHLVDPVNRDEPVCGTLSELTRIFMGSPRCLGVAQMQLSHFRSN